MNKKLLPMAFASILFGLLAANTLAVAAQATPDQKAAVKQKMQAQRLLAKELAPVKSLADFHRHIQSSGRAAAAFAKLPPAMQQDFIANLRFGEKGVSSLRLGILEDALSVTEAYDILALFGYQHAIAKMPGLKVKTQTDLLARQTVSPMGAGLDDQDEGFLEGYYCAGRGTCTKSTRDACTENC
jgi:hypothetical protein